MGLLLVPGAEASQGYGGYDYSILQPSALGIDSTGALITVDVRGQLLGFGNASTLRYQMFHSIFPAGPLVFLALDAPLVSTQGVGVISHFADLEPGARYVIGFEIWNAPTETSATNDGETLVYTVPSIEDVLSAGPHPLSGAIAGLGIPQVLTLGFIGLAFMMGTLAVAGIMGLDQETITAATVFTVGFNISMRFWPAVLFILMAFLLGFLVSRLFGGD